MQKQSLFNHKESVIFIGILFLVNMALFYLPDFPMSAPTITRSAPELQIPDIMVFYTPGQLYNFLAQIEASGREAFRGMHLTLDMVFPLIYSLFFFSLTRLLMALTSARNKAFSFSIFSAAVFDLAENLTLNIITASYPQILEGLSRLAQVFTLIKFALILFSVTIIIFYIIKFFTHKPDAASPENT